MISLIKLAATSNLKLNSSKDLNLPDVDLTSTFPQIITNTLTYIAGIVGVIFIVLAAIQYAISNGQSDKIQEAKRSLRAALAGLIIAVLARSIVVFVLQKGPQ